MGVPKHGADFDVRDGCRRTTSRRGCRTSRFSRVAKCQRINSILGEEDDEGLSYIFDVRVGLPQNT